MNMKKRPKNIFVFCSQNSYELCQKMLPKWHFKTTTRSPNCKINNFAIKKKSFFMKIIEIKSKKLFVLMFPKKILR